MRDIILFFLCFLVAADTASPQPLPLEYARAIGKRVIRDSDFSLVPVRQKQAEGIQVIDFRHAGSVGVGFAFAHISVRTDTTLSFGISYGQPLDISVNDSTVYRGRYHCPFHFAERGYSLYSFQDTFSVRLPKGDSRIVVGSLLDSGVCVYLREVRAPETKESALFRPVHSNDTNFVWPWRIAARRLRKEIPLVENLRIDRMTVDSIFSGLDPSLKTALQPPLTLQAIPISRGSPFRKHPYVDWQYANGTVMFSMLSLARATGDTVYEAYARRFCDFTVRTIPLFRRQYYKEHDLRGSNHRLFRRGMLDDTGAPVLPFVQCALEGITYDSLVQEMADYVSSGQLRLPDGTLCRPEPEPLTVWADDLFMSVPFLVRMGRLTGEGRYFDDAVRQVASFTRLLRDEKTGLFGHCWYAKREERSPVHWGRANGWMIWAMSEALLFLPKDHPGYTAVLKVFRESMSAVAAVQGTGGMWYQILDDPTTFEETSCTAMFIIGFARGVTNGWLPDSSALAARRAWQALRSRIDAEGVVRDICCGTSVGPPDYYRTRDRFPNDPRGLGAAITACIEVSRIDAAGEKPR